MNKPRCGACGCAYELHRADDLSCPSGGEAAPGEVQRWYPDLHYEKPNPRTKIFEEYDAERKRQDGIWGEQNHPIRDEAMRNINITRRAAYKRECDRRMKDGTVTWDDIAAEEYAEAMAEDTPEGQRHELVQLGAVVTAMIECIDRKIGRGS